MFFFFFFYGRQRTNPEIDQVLGSAPNVGVHTTVFGRACPILLILGRRLDSD